MIIEGEETDTEFAPVSIRSTYDDDEEFIDESLSERLWGLTEMFPEKLRNAVGTLFNFTVGASKICFSVGQTVAWIAVSSATILILPVAFENERAQHEEQQRQEQRQILLGPNAAMSGMGVGSSLIPGASQGPMSLFPQK